MSKKVKKEEKIAIATFKMEDGKISTSMTNSGIPNIVIVGLLDQLRLDILLKCDLMKNSHVPRTK